MTIVLSREKFILRREWPVDRSNVEIPPIGSRYEIGIRWNVRERHDRVAFSERGQHPFGQAENAEPCHRQTSFKNFPTRLLRHMELLM